MMNIYFFTVFRKSITQIVFMKYQHPLIISNDVPVSCYLKNKNLLNFVKYTIYVFFYILN